MFTIKNKLKLFYKNFDKTQKIVLLINFIVYTGIGVLGMIIAKNTSDYLGNTCSYLGVVISAMCGMLIAMKKVSNYYFGIVSVILLGLVAFHSKNIAVVALDVFYIPSQILGIYLGKKNVNKETNSVSHRQMSKGFYISIFSIAIVLSAIMTYVESLPAFYHFIYGNSYEPNSNSVIRGMKFACDGSTLFISIIAMILLLMRNKYQYILGMIVGILAIGLGTTTLISEPNEGIVVAPLLGSSLMSMFMNVYGIIQGKEKKKENVLAASEILV